MLIKLLHFIYIYGLVWICNYIAILKIAFSSSWLFAHNFCLMAYQLDRYLSGILCQPIFHQHVAESSPFLQAGNVHIFSDYRKYSWIRSTLEVVLRFAYTHNPVCWCSDVWNSISQLQWVDNPQHFTAKTETVFIIQFISHIFLISNSISHFEYISNGIAQFQNKRIKAVNLLLSKTFWCQNEIDFMEICNYVS